MNSSGAIVLRINNINMSTILHIHRCRVEIVQPQPSVSQNRAEWKCHAEWNWWFHAGKEGDVVDWQLVKQEPMELLNDDLFIIQEPHSTASPPLYDGVGKQIEYIAWGDWINVWLGRIKYKELKLKLSIPLLLWVTYKVYQNSLFLDLKQLQLL